MAGRRIFTAHGCQSHKLLLLCLSLLFLLYGCAGDASEQGAADRPAGASADTGSASLAIQWHTTEAVERASAVARQAIASCETAGVASITCEIYDASHNHLAGGGPWDCSDHQGTIDLIPAGSNRMFTVFGWNQPNADGGIVFQGQTENNITITPGETVDAGTIDAYAFIPLLYAPDNNAEVNPTNVSLEWEPLENADQYLVQVAEDVTFETIKINETTPATIFAPSELEASKAYFWKISAIDMHDNIGGESEVRSFVTSEGAVISGYIRTASGTGISGVTVSFSNNGGSATTDSSGYYSNTLSYKWSGTATPSTSGYNFNPPSRSYENIAADQSDQNFTGTQQTGSLHVTIYPAEDGTAGARWRVDGGDWHSSGYTQSGLVVGKHTVAFNTIDGWDRPGNQTVTITNNSTTNTSGTYTKLKPDLVITTGSPTVVWPPARYIYPGTMITLSNWTVKNQGEAASGDFKFGFYLSTDSTISTSDTFLSNGGNESLAPGAERNWPGPTLTIPTGIAPGSYYIGILVDYTNWVDESNESNNYVSTQLTVNGD